MTGHYRNILFVSLLLLSLAACKKFVEVGAPVNQLVTTSVFADNSTATAAILSIYAQMQTYPFYLHYNTALSSDEVYSTNATPAYVDVYTNALNAANDAGVLNFWGPGYNYIYQANAILENLQGSGSISASVKQQLTGEAKFIRAYFYFNLVNSYGAVPLITSTDYKVNSVMSRTPTTQVYQQIIADLKSAQSLLSPNYLDATDTTVTQDRVRPTSWAATALLARAYLYSGSYDSAETEASIVINNTGYGLSNLNQVFLANSTEAIWQIMNPSSANYTSDAYNFVLVAPPGSSTGNSTTISSQLLGAFETGDQRLTNWIGVYTDKTKTPAVSDYFPYKYKNNGTINTSTKEYTMILRLGEQFLIRAEARAHQNELNAAVDDLNKIRLRASLTGLSYNLSLAQILTAIAHERQVELFLEGQRWYDLKRTGAVDSIMNIATPAKHGLTWNTNQQWYPIPLESIQNDANLTQNNGY